MLVALWFGDPNATVTCQEPESILNYAIYYEVYSHRSSELCRIVEVPYMIYLLFLRPDKPDAATVGSTNTEILSAACSIVGQQGASANKVIENIRG